MDLEAVSTRGDSQIDTFISRMDTKRRDTEGERLEEELYAESVRRYNEERRLQARYEWHLHHVSQADRLRRTLEELVAFHEQQAAKFLEENEPEGETA